MKFRYCTKTHTKYYKLLNWNQPNIYYNNILCWNRKKKHFVKKWLKWWNFLSKWCHFIFSVCVLEHLLHWQLVGVLFFLFEFSTEISWKLHTAGHLCGATVSTLVFCTDDQQSGKVFILLDIRNHCNDVFHPTIQIWWKVSFLVFPFLAVGPGLSDHYRFCTCHDSCTVMACAKNCSDFSIDISMTSILNFHLSWIRRGNTKWAPAHVPLCCCHVGCHSTTSMQQ